MDAPDYYALAYAYAGAYRVPEFPMDEDFAYRGEWSANHADLSDQALLAGDHFVLSGFQGNGHKKDGNCTKRETQGEGGKPLHAHLRYGAIHQQECAQE